MTEYDKNEKIISVRDLSKRFEVKSTIARRDGFRDFFKKKSEFQGMGSEKRIVGNNFWALRDINFDVYRGETLGIIGVNGAGKTTLLKILTQILEPTAGEFEINGRVSSLIGAGVGFHLELSGKDNIFFNGALLGMSKKEIKKKLHQIIEFSELGSFIDTPVKYYSSGMRSRLGFSVAMNLDAEVMIIDESLAVGDINFKRKSTERMRETAFTGKTAIFVSHQMSIVQDVCTRVMWINEGRIVKMGDPEEVISAYLEKMQDKGVGNWKKEDGQTIGDSRITLEDMHIVVNGKKTRTKAISRNKKAEVELIYNIDRPSDTYSLGYTLLNDRGTRLFRSAINPKKMELKKGKNVLKATVPFDDLVNGDYIVAADADIAGDDWVINPTSTHAKLSFTLVSDRDDEWNTKREGLFKPSVTWKKSS